MPKPVPSPNIDLHLVKVLHTVVSERSVSRAAVRLQTSQPVVSAQLRRLRALTGDALLVRSGRGLAPTDAALALLEPAARLLREAELLFSPAQRRAPFVPATSTLAVRIAASDYLDPWFLPGVVARLKASAPGLQVELQPLSAEFDYRRKLAAGEVDLVVGNWLEPPGELHLGRLTADEVVCLVAADHPAVRRPREWTVQRYLDAEHVAPAALHPGAPGVIDEHLRARGLQRRIGVRAAHFSLIPAMVARTRLVLTTGRRFCERFCAWPPGSADGMAALVGGPGGLGPASGAPGLRIVPCPVPFPPMSYYQLWHDRTHAAPAWRWVREQVREVARELAGRPAGMMQHEGLHFES
ncbi:MAG: LysR family transcriptional regulator [Rubrivivax sp.]